MPYELHDECLTWNLRIRFGYKSADFLGESEQDALKAAVAKAKDLKLNGRDAAFGTGSSAVSSAPRRLVVN